jgi:hypothetical protein
MLQYESVLNRSEHLLAAAISVADVEVLLDAIALIVEPIRISYLWRPVARHRPSCRVSFRYSSVPKP